MRRNSLVAAALLVLFGAARQAAIPSSAKADGPAVTTASAAHRDPARAALCSTLRSYFGEKETGLSDASPCLQKPREILFLLAAAPNPANSLLALSFDRALDSIQRAVEDCDFVYDRFAFPWKAQSTAESAEREAALDAAAQPGMLLFRGVPDDPSKPNPLARYEALAVLLIPESPSSGVNAAVFRAAAEFARRNSPPSSRKVLLFGPNYSSSARSLRRAMDESSLAFTIRTGSATVPSAWKELAQADGRDFAAAVRNDKESTDALRAHIGSTPECKKSGAIAFLSESATSYGGYYSEVSRQISGRVLNLVFPRGVSWLRNAYQDAPAAPPSSNLPASAAQLPRLLPFDVAEPIRGDDKPQTLSKTQTPLSAETVLLNIAATLRREGVRFAVITATDPLDTIFLMRFLSEHCPDTRLFTSEADILYIRAASEFPATGVVVATTYPLFSRNQYWTASSQADRRIQFASMSSEGSYNAIIDLLSQAARQLDPAAGPAADLLDYRDPFDPASDRPPVWLVTTARSGYWPLAVVTQNQLASQCQKDDISGCVLRARSQRRDPAQSFQVERASRVWYSIAAFLLLGCGLVLRALFGAAECREKPILCQLAHEPRRDEYSFGRLTYRIVFSMAAAMLSILTAWPVIRLWDYGPGLGARIGSVLLALVALVTLAAPVWRWLPPPDESPAPPQKRGYGVQLGVAISLFGLLIVLWAGVFHVAGHHEDFFAAYRSLDLTNGVSPTAPFLVLTMAILVWALVNLRRLNLYARSPRFLPKFDGDSTAGQLADRLNDALSMTISRPARFAGEALVFVILLIMARQYTQSLELWRFDALYGWMFWVVIWLLFFTWARLMLVWTRFHKLLDHFEIHSIRDDFAKINLPEEWGPIMRRAAPKPKDDLSSCTAYIHAACRQMENLLIFITVGFVLALLSANCYPFQARQVLGWLLANILIVVGAGVVYVLAGADRHPILSRINNTTPGRIGKNFYLSLASYAGIPVLTIIAAQFPSIERFLFSWVQPALQALRG